MSDYGYVLLPGHLIGKRVMVVEMDDATCGMVVRPFGNAVKPITPITPRRAEDKP